MPRILIKEKDGTTPGTPGRYSNYDVLIIGFASHTEEELKAAKIQPDANGVYEFNSATDFEKTIGLVAPQEAYSKATYGQDGTITKTELNLCPPHYGNQMAFELLKAGYSIVYKPITTEEVELTVDDVETQAANSTKVQVQVKDDTFWKIFKDKASYDFRFITHGFLRDLSYEEIEACLLQKSQVLKELATRENELNKAWKALSTAYSDAYIAFKADGNKQTLDELVTTKYAEILQDKEEYPGLKPGNEDTYYDSFADAVEGIRGYRPCEKVGEGEQQKEQLIEYGEGALPTNEASSESGELNSVIASREEETKKIKTNAENLAKSSLIDKVNEQIANLAMYKTESNESSEPAEQCGRGDCVALIELNENDYLKGVSTERPEALIINAINESSITIDNGKYCAMTVPSVCYKMKVHENFKDNKKFPGAFHYLACFINSLASGYAEWYAAAGYTRGVSSYTVDYTTVKLGEVAINSLEPRNSDQKTQPKFACNVIANFRGSYYLWGNRTAHELNSPDGTDGDLVASHFLNIRHLCTTIKKQLYVACRRFTFDPNSDTLWVNFVNAIRPTLEAMKADQGIRDFKIIKEYTDKKATLKAKIRIIPIEAVEDFDLEISLEDSFGETSANVGEVI